jgi:hypothetical protein
VSRRSEKTKHPALALQGKSIEQDPLWDTLLEEQQRFLASYAATRDAYSAARNIGLSQTWIDEQLEDASFHVLMDAVSASPVEFGTHIIKSMVPMSVLKLNDLMNSKSEKVVLDAIKHLHNVAKMTGNDSLPTGQQLNVQVNMFPMNGHAPQPD